MQQKAPMPTQPPEIRFSSVIPLIKELFARRDPIKSEKSAQGIEWLKTHAQRMDITSRDGLRLAGYYMAGGDKLAVLVHGYHSVAGDICEYSRIYTKHGFSVLMTDNRGCGESEGKYVGMGWLDRLDILDWLKEMKEKFGERETVLHGVSMGATASILATAETEAPGCIKAVISDCAFSTGKDEFAYRLKDSYNLPRFPIINMLDRACLRMAGYRFSNANAERAAAASKVPMFFIHGAEDTFTPPIMAKALYRAKKSNRGIWIAPEAPHACSYWFHKEEYEKRVIGFISHFVQIPKP